MRVPPGAPRETRASVATPRSDSPGLTPPRVPSLAARPGPDVYAIRTVFRVPLGYAFRWCTDYSPEDGRLSKEGNRRRIVRRSRRQIVYEDLTDTSHGWSWSRQTVTLHPPDRWTAVARGNYRNWQLAYELRSLGTDRTELRMRGVRRPVLLGRRNPSQRLLRAELLRMWRHFGRAMEADYRRSRHGSAP